VTPAIPPTALPARASDGKKAAFIAGALLAAIGGTVGIMKLTAKPAPQLPPVVATSTLPPKIETVPPPVAPPPPAATGETAKPNVELQSAKLAAPAKKETLPPEVASELDAAEKSIDSDPQEAIRQARHTLATAKSSRAFAVIARAYCKQGDLGNAKAALHSVGGADRPRVMKYCKAAGTDLQ
jgi:eukaryotic-like serine/threonine-protein kinase